MDIFYVQAKEKFHVTVSSQEKKRKGRAALAPTNHVCITV